MERFLNKTYKLQHTDNGYEFSKAVGMGYLTKKIYNTTGQTLCLKSSGPHSYILHLNSPLRMETHYFTLDIESEQVTFDGRHVISLFTLEGTTLTEVQTDVNTGQVTTISSTFSEDTVLTYLTVDDVTCVRIYKLLDEEENENKVDLTVINSKRWSRFSR